MNKVIMAGNLSKDVDLRTTQSGKVVASFTIAVNRRFKNQAGEAVTDFFPVVAWDNRAEMCGKYLSKGKKVAIVGELQTRSYEDKNGVKRYVTEIVADEVEFLSPKEKRELTDESPTAGYTDDTDSNLPF
jgi:single-strand DNA-binding protein